MRRFERGSVVERNKVYARRSGAWASLPKYWAKCDIDELLYDIQDGKCLYCQTQLVDGHVHRDHIISQVIAADILTPYAAPSNFALTCDHCNRSKNSQWYINWINKKFKDKASVVLQRVAWHITTIRKETGEDKWREAIGLHDVIEYAGEHE